jgi:hypothetical protein
MYRTDYNLRLGFPLSLPTGHQDKWWTVDPTTELPDLAQELLGHLRRSALPEIKRLISDEGLRDPPCDREHALADAGYLAADVHEAPGAAVLQVDDKQRLFVADAVEDVADQPADGDPVLGYFFRTKYG